MSRANDVITDEEDEMEDCIDLKADDEKKRKRFRSG
jgi:hypothetical protein